MNENGKLVFARCQANLAVRQWKDQRKLFSLVLECRWLCRRVGASCTATSTPRWPLSCCSSCSRLNQGEPTTSLTNLRSLCQPLTLFAYYVHAGLKNSLNPFPDKRLYLIDIVRKQVCHFSSRSIVCVGCTISRRAARRPIVLHPKHNIESQLKWQTC